MRHRVLLSFRVFAACAVRWLQQFYPPDEIGAEKRVMEIDPDLHARLQTVWRSLYGIMPELGPLTVNKSAHWAAILREDDPSAGMIDALDYASHTGAARRHDPGVDGHHAKNDKHQEAHFDECVHGGE